MVAGTVDPQEMASSLWLQCCHKGNHKKTLSGLDQEGRFLTTAAAQYPSSMNQILVDLHVSAFLARGEPSERVEGPELLQEPGLQDRKTAVRRGDRCRAPPLADFWDSKPWSLEFSTRWQREEPSNVVESRQILLSLRHLSSSAVNWDTRTLLFTDNLCSLSVFGKGRSSSRSLRHMLRRASAICLCFGMRIVLRWVPSLRNQADGPSRGKPVGAPTPAAAPVKPVVGRTYHG